MQIHRYKFCYAIHVQKIAISNRQSSSSCVTLTKKQITAHTLSSNLDNYYTLVHITSQHHHVTVLTQFQTPIITLCDVRLSHQP